MGDEDRNGSESEPPSREGEPAEAEGPDAEPKTPPPPSTRRKWIFRLAGMVLVPLLFFGLLEGSLRLFGFGYETDFFVPLEGKDALGTNLKFTWRFFPRPLARPPLPLVVPKEKPEGAYRIFVLGGSAAQGEPSPPFAFSRHLEMMFRARFPEATIEVFNTAITAVNSHVVLPIARECAEREPDLLVVYMGNNEVVGPYGPGTILKGYSPSLGAIRTGIWVKSTKIGQLMEGAIGLLGRGSQAPKEWKGMEMFLDHRVAYQDPRLAKVYSHFEANLEALCRAATRKGAGVLLCTMATNLKDCAPFASLHGPDLPVGEQKRWKALVDEALASEEAGEIEQALALIDRAAAIDDRVANLHFVAGRLLWAQKKTEAARDRFLRARDLDALRFRADTRINEIIRKVASAHGEAGVELVDVERLFQEAPETQNGVPGEELLYEHVHMNFKGNHLVARALFKAILPRLPEGVRGGVPAEGEPCSREACADRLAFTGWDRVLVARRLDTITGRAPFTNQIDYALRSARWEEDRKALEARYASGEGLLESFEVYRRAVVRDPDDLPLRNNYAVLLMEMKSFEKSIEQYRFLRERVPGIPAWREAEANVHLEHGTQLVMDKKPEEALKAYDRALELWPGFSKAYFNIGVTLESQGKRPEAIEQYRLAIRAEPGLVMARNNLAFALAAEGKREEAVEAYRRALEIAPGFAMAHGNLADTLVKMGRREEALEHYRQALKHNPQAAEAHGNLAATLIDLGRPSEAAPHYLKMLELKPDWPVALKRVSDLAWLLATHRNPAMRNGPEAVRLAEHACKFTQYDSPLHLGTLAAALAETGRFDDAIRWTVTAKKKAKAKGQDAVVKELEELLQILRSGQPIRD
ncbi:MAG: tetratricopeptide repeat protein [Planctomycetota bacterium]|jgi:tetratricopeptide (TPR) repeat protein